MTGPTASDPIDALRGDGLARLWIAIRKRLENNRVRITAVPLRLKDLRADEIEALCGLLGRRRPNGTEMNVDLRSLDRSLLDSSVGLGLLDTLTRLGGPIRDRATERTDSGLERAALWMAGVSHPVSSFPGVLDWVESLQRRGRLTRLVGASNAQIDPGEVLTGALDGVHWLLANADTLVPSPLPISMIAAAQFGDAHALDADTPVGVLLRDALSAITGRDDERQALAAVGVQLDQVATSALTLGLPGRAGSICGAARQAGEPLRVTWRMAERGFGLDVDALLDGRRPVSICENPGIVAVAADRLGGAAAPLICTEGMPASVTAALLRDLTDAGVRLRVHTDFDLGGVAIMRHVVDRFDAAPWAMSAIDYRAALDGPTVALAHEIGSTPWDPALSAAMNEHRRAIHEETIAWALVADLRENI